MTEIALVARSAPLTFSIERTAVVVVDMQNDFGSDGGMFQRAGIDISPIKEIVPNVASLLRAARDAGVQIVYLKQQHHTDLSDAGGAGAPHLLKHLPLGIGDTVQAPDGSSSRILVENTWNTAIVDALAPQSEDIIVGDVAPNFYPT